LESLAIPGGICISGTVYDQIENKLSLNYDYQGEQTVKNIAKPVRTYRVVMDEADNRKAEDSASQKSKVKGQKAKIEGQKFRWLSTNHYLWTSVAVLVFVTVIAVAVRYRSSPIPSPQHPGASVAALARQTLDCHPALHQHE
jgi:hypothetical protein